MAGAKMQTKYVIACLLSITIFISPKLCGAKEEKSEDTVDIVTEYSYQIGKSDSLEKYRALALFGAKRKAVELSAKYLAHKNLLPEYGKKQKEIFCLAADEISADILEDKRIKDNNSYHVKIKAKIRSVDFLKAEIKDFELEKAEMSFSWQEELGQPVYKSIEPAKELSRAYRYLRKGHSRITVIYLDHLEKKYPNWAEMYHVKAIGLYIENKRTEMMGALKTSCSLGNREACEDIEGFVQGDSAFKTY